MLTYPAKFTPAEEGGFVVTFPDIPEAITQGDDEDDALQMASEALELALDFYFETHRSVPRPSRAKRGQRMISLPVSVSAKILLWNEMVRQKVKPAELARRLHMTRQEVNRLTDIRHATKIDAIAGALLTLGKTLEVRTV